MTSWWALPVARDRPPGSEGTGDKTADESSPTLLTDGGEPVDEEGDDWGQFSAAIDEDELEPAEQADSDSLPERKTEQSDNDTEQLPRQGTGSTPESEVEEGASEQAGEAGTGLGFDFEPHELPAKLAEGHQTASETYDYFEDFCDPDSTRVAYQRYLWEHLKRDKGYYNDDGQAPRDSNGDRVPFDGDEPLSFDKDEANETVQQAAANAHELKNLVDRRTVDVQEQDEDAFFSTTRGYTTIANRYDLEKTVQPGKKQHFKEIDRYWVNKPYAFVILFKSEKENEIKYYVVEPHLNQEEKKLRKFLRDKLQDSIKYSREAAKRDNTAADRAEVIQEETHRLLKRYNIADDYELERTYQEDDEEDGDTPSIADAIKTVIEDARALFGDGEPDDGPAPEQTELSLDDEFALESPEAGELIKDAETETVVDPEFIYDDPNEIGSVSGISARPVENVVEEGETDLNQYQVEKLVYYLKRDFIGYDRIDPIKHDINVEDISCDGYYSPVFVYHTDYEQIISNIYHGEDTLDDFVVKLAQRSGKGISKRNPQVDATLPDGSRAQLTLGTEVSDHGTNYTIRQFKDVPFTPIDLVNWKTFGLEEMAFLWLCIENHKSLIFAGGTASGKTTSLNAISLFIPSNAKIVSIEDTREVELPQRNWIASVTRPSFGDDDKGDVDEFDLLEAALRQRPDYIVMGEIRGEEGRTLFQVMSTGHTTYTTFHADSVGEVLKRFTTDPINVSKTLFTALDLVSIQTQTRVGGNKVRRNKVLTEINDYSAENDEINVQDVYQWDASTDEFERANASSTLEEIKTDRGWDDDRLQDELFKRRVVFAYLILNDLNEYTKVAATVQAYINDPDAIFTLIANGDLNDSLENLREMESVLIDVDPEKEEMVPRPDPSDEIIENCKSILKQAEERLFPEYRSRESPSLVEALPALSDVQDEPDIPEDDIDEREALEEATPDETGELAGAAEDDDDTPALEVESEFQPLDRDEAEEETPELPEGEGDGDGDGGDGEDGDEEWGDDRTMRITGDDGDEPTNADDGSGSGSTEG